MLMIQILLILAVNEDILLTMELAALECLNKNSAEVDIASPLGEITTACNVCKAKPGSGVCMKCTEVEHHINFDKIYAAWNEGQGHVVMVNAWRMCLSVSRTITMQGFLITAITAAVKFTLVLDLM